MKLRAFAVFAIVTLLPSSATAQQSNLCFKVEASYGLSRHGSSPDDALAIDAEAIAESIAEILVENLPEAWSCEFNRDANKLWFLYGVTVALVDSPDRGHRYFDAYLSFGSWNRFTEPAAPQVIMELRDHTSVRDVAETFELRIRQTIREARWGAGEPQR